MTTPGVLRAIVTMTAAALLLSDGALAGNGEGSIVIATTTDGGGPITPDDMVGEWTGLAENSNLLLVLRIDQPTGPVTLAVAKQQETDISVRTVHFERVDVQHGRFSLQAPGVSLQGTGNASWGSAWGQARITFREAGLDGAHVFFFRIRDQSWAERMLALCKAMPY